MQTKTKTVKETSRIAGQKGVRMKRKMLSGKDLIKIGYPEGKAIGIAINTVLKYFRRSEKDEIFEMLRGVLADPKKFVDDSIWNKTALALVPGEKKSRVHELLKNRIEYPIYGAAEIEEGARNQMEIAMKLPVTMAGALMPDAHQGYGLPIGGVLATNNAVIPYGVGVDIGCRMCLTAYSLDEKFLERHRANLKQILIDNTRFGYQTFQRAKDHEVLYNKAFDEIPVVRNLRGKAIAQIGSSGSGNHFVEFGLMTLHDNNE